MSWHHCSCTRAAIHARQHTVLQPVLCALVGTPHTNFCTVDMPYIGIGTPPSASFKHRRFEAVTRANKELERRSTESRNSSTVIIARNRIADIGRQLQQQSETLKTMQASAQEESSLIPIQDKIAELEDERSQIEDEYRKSDDLRSFVFCKLLQNMLSMASGYTYRSELRDYSLYMCASANHQRYNLYKIASFDSQTLRLAFADAAVQEARRALEDLFTVSIIRLSFNCELQVVDQQSNDACPSTTMRKWVETAPKLEEGEESHLTDTLSTLLHGYADAPTITLFESRQTDLFADDFTIRNLEFLDEDVVKTEPNMGVVSFDFVRITCKLIEETEMPVEVKKTPLPPMHDVH